MAVSGKQGSDIFRRHLRPVCAVAARLEDAIRSSPSASKTPLAVGIGDNLLASLSRKRRSVQHSTRAPHHAVILGFAHHSVRLHTLYCRVPCLSSTTFSCRSKAQVRLAQMLSYFRRPFGRSTWHQMLLRIGKCSVKDVCIGCASLTAMANVFSLLLLVQHLYSHLLVGPVVIHCLNLAWYLVYLALLYILPLYQDWSAVIGAFVFPPIGDAQHHAGCSTLYLANGLFCWL
jgi:hypothetical protein